MTEKTKKEKIYIERFHSSQALKEEIRNRIQSRHAANWTLAKMETRESVILLTFSPK